LSRIHRIFSVKLCAGEALPPLAWSRLSGVETLSIVPLEGIWCIFRAPERSPPDSLK
jgi:hypothetical protein